MSCLPTSIRGGAYLGGGVLSYPSDQLYEEVAYLSMHVNWSLDEILNLEHPDRRRWVTEVGQLRGER